MVYSEPNGMKCPIPCGPTPEFFTKEQVCYIAENNGIPPFKVLNEESIRKLVIIRSSNPSDREIFYGSDSVLDFVDAYEARKREERKARQRKARKQSGAGEQPAKYNKGEA